MLNPINLLLNLTYSYYESFLELCTGQSKPKTDTVDDNDENESKSGDGLPTISEVTY